MTNCKNCGHGIVELANVLYHDKTDEDGDHNLTTTCQIAEEHTCADCGNLHVLNWCGCNNPEPKEVADKL